MISFTKLFIFFKKKSFFSVLVIGFYCFSAIIGSVLFFGKQFQLSVSQAQPLTQKTEGINKRNKGCNKQFKSTQSSQDSSETNLFDKSGFTFSTAVKGGTVVTNPSVDLFSQDPQNHDFFVTLDNNNFGLWKCSYDDWAKNQKIFYPLRKFYYIPITSINYTYNPEGVIQSQIMWLGTTNEGFFTAILNHDDNNSWNNKATKPNNQIFSAPTIQSTVNYIQSNSFYALTYFVDADHNFWMSAAGLGLFLSRGIFTKDKEKKYDWYDHKTWEAADAEYPFLARFNYTHSNISYISQDSDGDYYFGARDYQTGLIEVKGSKNDSGKVVYTKPIYVNIIGNVSVNYVLFDSNLIYVCASGLLENSDDGLYIYDIKKKTITIAPMLKNISVSRIIISGKNDFVSTTDGLYQLAVGSKISDNDRHDQIISNKSGKGWQKIAQFSSLTAVNNVVAYTPYQKPTKNTKHLAGDTPHPSLLACTGDGIYNYDQPKTDGIASNNSTSGFQSRSYVEKINNQFNYDVTSTMFFHYWSNKSFSGLIKLDIKSQTFEITFPVSAIKEPDGIYSMFIIFQPTLLDPNVKDKNVLPKSIIDQCDISIHLQTDDQKSTTDNTMQFFILFNHDIKKVPDILKSAFASSLQYELKTFLNYDYSVTNNIYYPLFYHLQVKQVVIDISKLGKLILDNNNCFVATLNLVNKRSSASNYQSFTSAVSQKSTITLSTGNYIFKLENQLGLVYQFYLQVGGSKLDSNFFISKPFKIPNDKNHKLRTYLAIFVPIFVVVSLAVIVLWWRFRWQPRKLKLQKQDASVGFTSFQ